MTALQESLPSFSPQHDTRAAPSVAILQHVACEGPGIIRDIPGIDTRLLLDALPARVAAVNRIGRTVFARWADLALAVSGCGA